MIGSHGNVTSMQTSWPDLQTDPDARSFVDAGYTCLRRPQAARAPGGRSTTSPLHTVCEANSGATAVFSKHADTSCRDFVMSTYRELKQANPKFPILVREAETAQAKLIARFGETAHPKRHCRAACCMHVFLHARISGTSASAPWAGHAV